MVPKKITSLQHPLVKHWLQLRTDRTYREETQRVLVSGKKMAEELQIDILIALEPSSTIQSKETYLVTEPILKKITGLNQPDGFAAELSLPPQKNLTSKKYLLILDQIADPGNLGTLFRTALALNWEGVILTPGTVDLFNDKSLRAAKGAQFHLPYQWMSPQEIISLNLHLYTADLEGVPLQKASFDPPLGLILSSEGQGAGAWSNTISKKIHIPMNEQSESLNVASSGAILLYAMRNP